MDRPIANQTLHRVASYALVVLLSVGATIAPSVSEARFPEERPTSASGSTTTTQPRQELIGNWFATVDDQTRFQPSFFQSWLASVYYELIGLKAAIGSLISSSWKWSHDKADNACS